MKLDRIRFSRRTLLLMSALIRQWTLPPISCQYFGRMGLILRFTHIVFAWRRGSRRA